MGLLSAGVPLDWEDMGQWQEHVRKYGVQQFIRLYNRLKVEQSAVGASTNSFI
jgi:glutamate--cysteine ligase catalytic subunit